MFCICLRVQTGPNTTTKQELILESQKLPLQLLKLVLEASAGGGLADADVSLSGGAITNLQSCNSAGNTSIDHNISDHTKITTTGTAPAVGFNVNLIGLFGRKLDGLGDGTHEVDINGTRVSQGSGIFFRSGLNGTYKIIARPSSTSFVVGKKEILVWIQARKQVVLLDQDG